MSDLASGLSGMSCRSWLTFFTSTGHCHPAAGHKVTRWFNVRKHQDDWQSCQSIQASVNKFLGENTVFLKASDKSISSFRWIEVLKGCKNVLGTSKGFFLLFFLNETDVNNSASRLGCHVDRIRNRLSVIHPGLTIMGLINHYAVDVPQEVASFCHVWEGWEDGLVFTGLTHKLSTRASHRTTRSTFRPCLLQV